MHPAEIGVWVYTVLYWITLALYALAFWIFRMVTLLQSGMV